MFLTDPFFWEVVISGLLAGVMYSLVALGFVLIFKASGIFNFAQGVMALFAALTLVGFQTGQIPFAHVFSWILGVEVHHWGEGLPTILSLILTVGVMIGVAWLVVNVILKQLVNMDGIILFMATIGLALIFEGGGDLMWGSTVKTLDVGLPENAPSDTIIDATGMFISKLEIAAAVVALLLVVSLTIFSQYTKMGRALRAVADDHQAALSVGISLETIWWIVWSVAGIVALVAGMMWGAKSGIQFSLSLIALKALPVLMLGGFTSIPGAIIGGLLIGVGEKLFEFYVGSAIGGATENWFAYVLALLFLLIRPQGLFGDKIIERV